MTNKIIYPGQTIGMLGGGQLGRMLAIAGREMGYRFAVLDPGKDNPCEQVSDFAIHADYGDPDAVKSLASKVDVATYEFENIDLTTTDYLKEHNYLPQGSELLKVTRDRLTEKQTIEESGQTVVPYQAVQTGDDLKNAVEKLGLPAVLKTRRGGYDGKGQTVLRTETDVETATADLDGSVPFILEKWISFKMEVSVMVSRSTNGEIAVYPVAENIHRNNILHHTIVPARISEDNAEKAKSAAVELAKALNLVGTLGVEMFLTDADEICINECAPRPHNSGHYTIEACETSQFQQHIRAICGLPLGKTTLHKPVIMVNILGQHVPAVLDGLPSWRDVNVHLYGKEEAKVNRKMGHVTILADTVDEAIHTAEELGVWKINDEVAI